MLPLSTVNGAAGGGSRRYCPRPQNRSRACLRLGLLSIVAEAAHSQLQIINTSSPYDISQFDCCLGAGSMVGIRSTCTARWLVLHLDGTAANGGCPWQDRKSTRLNSSHVAISYAVFCLKK